MKRAIVKFAPRGAESFYDEVKREVADYFEGSGIDPHANTTMRVKTVAMLSMYFLPLAAIVSGLTAFSPVLFFMMWLLAGLGIVGIGVSVMHDSNHGSYADNDTVNTILGNMLSFIGGYAVNWKIQHNILHHTYTNVEGLDEDLEAGKLIRLSPNKPLLKMHRFQHLYAWAIYSITTLYWVTAKDYRMLFRYEKEGLLRKQKITLRKALIELSVYKVIYFGYILVLPMLFSGYAWYMVLAGFTAMHLLGGLLMTCIFQPAHVIPNSDYALPDANGKMENNWALHQVINTTNFCPNSKITSWFIGGLNYQIEHHLFPQVCHVHYPAISKIVKRTAREHGVPYQVLPTFMSAIWHHGKMLKTLGREPQRQAERRQPKRELTAA